MAKLITDYNEADEITIKYIEDKGLVDFLEKFSSQRINLLVNPMFFKEMEVRKLIAIRNTYPQYDFAVAMTTYDPVLGDSLAKADIKYYEASPCLNWERFNYLVREGVETAYLPQIKEYEENCIIIFRIVHCICSFSTNTSVCINRSC